MDPAVIVQILVGLGGFAGLAALVSAFYTRRKIYAEAEKTGADAAQVLSAASVALLSPMENQIDRLSTQLTDSQARADELDGKLRKAKVDLRSCTDMITDLQTQLTYYRDKYGPPTDELSRVPNGN